MKLPIACVAVASLSASARLESADAKPLPTVDGPEAKGLIDKLKGALVYPKAKGGILALSLPGLKTRTVRAPGDPPAISELSSPDTQGRLAVVESTGKEVLLRIVRSEGTSGEELTRRPDLGFRSKAIGRPALASAGDLVAFVSKTATIYMKGGPKVSSSEGKLEVWRVGERKALGDIDVKALDRSLAWVSGKDELLFGALVGPETFDPLIAPYGEGMGKSQGVLPVTDDRRVPVIHRLELPGKRSAPICIGRRAVVSNNGKLALVQAIGFEWMLCDLSSGRLRPAQVPGLYDRDTTGVYEGGIVALVGEDLAIYWGLPTTGAEQRSTTNNSPLVGAKSMPTIKVARLGSGEFQTLVPYMDPRDVVQFGSSPEGK